MMREFVQRAALLAAFAAPALGLAACGDANGGAPSGAAPVVTGAPARSAQDAIGLRAIGYDRGAPGAPIVVLEFSDFGCPYCARFALETFPLLAKEYIDSGRVYWRYIPFVMGNFPNGAEAARAAECAGEQGEVDFWGMHDLLYEHQREWKSSRDPAPVFRRLAAELDLDPGRFDSCYAGDRRGARTREANRVAAYAGVRATPTFIINGRRVQGALPVEQFRMIFRELLAR